VGTAWYDGVFHCRFWRLGRWYDVYVDDYLPVCDDTRLPWGARSTDPDEMWVPLIEKAFARYINQRRTVMRAFLAASTRIHSCMYVCLFNYSQIG